MKKIISMAEELLQKVEVADAAPEKQERQRPKAQETKEVSLDRALGKLAKYGGFSFLESCVDGIPNLNPERKARKKIFFTDESKRGERNDLKKTLTLWIDLLSGSKDISDMLDRCKDKEAFVSELLNKNQRIAIDTVKELERSYRAVMLFYTMLGHKLRYQIVEI